MKYVDSVMTSTVSSPTLTISLHANCNNNSIKVHLGFVVDVDEERDIEGRLTRPLASLMLNFIPLTHASHVKSVLVSGGLVLSLQHVFVAMVRHDSVDF